jgi:hypothetical protein
MRWLQLHGQPQRCLMTQCGSGLCHQVGRCGSAVGSARDHAIVACHPHASASLA